MAASRLEWKAPLAHLRALPFVREIDFDPAAEILELTTPRGRHRLSVEVKRSYLDRTLVNAMLSQASGGAGGKRRTNGVASARMCSLAIFRPRLRSSLLLLAFLSRTSRVTCNWKLASTTNGQSLANGNRPDLLMPIGLRQRPSSCYSNLRLHRSRQRGPCAISPAPLALASLRSH